MVVAGGVTVLLVGSASVSAFFESKVTVYVSAIHFANTVISSVTVVLAVNSLPPPPSSVNQPSKLKPVFSGGVGSSSTVFVGLFTVLLVGSAGVVAFFESNV